MKTVCFCFALLAILLPRAPSLNLCARGLAAAALEITVDANAASHPFPHFWRKCLVRARHFVSARKLPHDLRETKRITDFEYVRFHAIFHDEAGLYDEDRDGQPLYNFSYVDQIYDGLLENKVRRSSN